MACAISSFLETSVPLYTRELRVMFAGDAAFVEWLDGTWEPEESGHGAMMREYLSATWPEYHWEDAYAAFIAEYVFLSQRYVNYGYSRVLAFEPLSEGMILAAARDAMREHFPLDTARRMMAKPLEMVSPAGRALARVLSLAVSWKMQPAV